MNSLRSRALIAGLTSALAASAFVPLSAAETAEQTASPLCTTTTTLSSGSVNWGIKQSFRNYMQLGFFGNSWSLGDSASFVGGTTDPAGAFSFPVNTAASSVSEDGAQLATSGSVHFVGHGGALDITVSDIRLNISGSTGTITADYSSKDMADASVTHTGDDVVLATLSGVSTSSTPTENGNVTTTTYTINSTGTAFGPAATSVFGSHYSEGQTVDAASATVTTTSVTECVEPEPSPEPSQPAEPEQPSPQPSEPSEPTPEPSTPAPQPSNPGEPEQPTPQPSQPSEPSNPSQPSQPEQPSEPKKAAAVTSGQLQWGLKESWRRYILMPMNNGWMLDGVSFRGNTTGSDGAFLFNADPARSTLDAQGNGTIATTGSVRFTGHNSALDITLNNVQVHLNNGQGTITADYSTKDIATGEVRTGTQAVIANLADVRTTSERSATLTTWTMTSSTVTFGEAAPTIFGAQYAPGTAVDPVRLVVGTSTTSDETIDGPGGNSENPARPQQPAQPGQPPVVIPAQPGTSGSTGSQNNTSAPAQSEPVCRTEGYQVSAGSFSWGIKSSFISYLQGNIAKGSISASGGASFSGGSFSFTAASGTADPAAGTATVLYSGTAHMTGHGGKLDLMITNPSVVMTSPSAGYITATVSSTDTSGAARNLGTVRLADVTFSSAQVSEKSVSLQASSVSLSAEGAQAFAGYYEAGQALDIFTATATLSDNIVCRDAHGRVISGNSLARTGVDSTLIPLAVGGAFLTVLGALVLSGSRRRSARA